MKNSELSAEQQGALLETLEARFHQNKNRHKDISWSSLQTRLKATPEKLASLYEMEMTGGEPDVISFDATSGTYIFYDCAPESPQGRRSICYDRKALETRKTNRPENSAMDMAASMGIEILSEEQYRALQKLGAFDLKTSSWVKTPSAIRELGGALFCDRRYNTVFTYHNGAESYYSARGFRGCLIV